MNKTILKTKITPIIAITIILLLFAVPSIFGNLNIIVVSIIALIASYIEYGKHLFLSLGFRRNSVKLKSLLIKAPIIAIALFLLYSYILIPAATHLTAKPIDFSQFDVLQGNLLGSLVLLVFIWISAAFGEEITFRGYIMRQLVKFFGDGKLSMLLNILLLGLLFGYVHSYQGITGQIVTGVLGVILATIFYRKKYDLWFTVAIHGFFDTIGLVFMYNGWY